MVRAPFILQTLSGCKPGEAPGDRWYIVPFQLWKRRVYSQYPRTVVKLSFDYALGAGQYVGVMIANRGKEVWRQM